jgi:hypothetical protein
MTRYRIPFVNGPVAENLTTHAACNGVFLPNGRDGKKLTT